MKYVNDLLLVLLEIEFVYCVSQLTLKLNYPAKPKMKANLKKK